MGENSSASEASVVWVMSTHKHCPLSKIAKGLKYRGEGEDGEEGGVNKVGGGGRDLETQN